MKQEPATYRCIRCACPLSVDTEVDASVRCGGCGMDYKSGPSYLKCECDVLLLERFGRRYLMNKVLNNNGYLSYLFLKEESLSLTERSDVRQFRDYVLGHARRGRLIDAGCGILALPGYLDFGDKEGFELFGIDPIDDRSFRGMRVVGCTEFMPFEDGRFDTVVFATSLDHVVSLDQALAETHRVLCVGGRVVIWMSDKVPFRERLHLWLNRWRENIRKGYRADRFFVYPNHTVLYVPPGAVDPFHSYRESPAKIVSLMLKRGFCLRDCSRRGRGMVFLCFEKTAGRGDRR